MTDDTPTPDGVQAARLDRVRKLLAKAERAGTPDEAEIYTEKAVALMARHGIDDALLSAGRPAASDPIGGSRYSIEDPYSGGKARLLGWIAAASGCRWVMHDMRRGKVDAVTVFGHQSDRERVDLLYTSLLLQTARPLREARPPHRHESVAAYRRSWLYGFAGRVSERIEAARQRAVREVDAERQAAAGPAGAGSGAEVVLADRAALVDRAYSDEFGKLRTARRPTISGSGFARGVEAAERADIGATRVGQTQRPALR